MIKVIIVLFIFFALVAIFIARKYSNKNRKATEAYQTERVVVDDKVIALDDVHSVIAPLRWLVSIYDGEKKYENDLKPFTLPQRYVFAIQWYADEVYNGGHHQFYFNSTGIVWADALKGFEVIGAESNAAIIRESVNRMGGNPSKDRGQRCEALDELEPDFEDLDDAFYNDDSYRELLHAYIRENASAFYFDGEVKVPKLNK